MIDSVNHSVGSDFAFCGCDVSLFDGFLVFGQGGQGSHLLRLGLLFQLRRLVYAAAEDRVFQMVLVADDAEDDVAGGDGGPDVKRFQVSGNPLGTP